MGRVCLQRPKKPEHTHTGVGGEDLVIRTRSCRSCSYNPVLSVVLLAAVLVFDIVDRRAATAPPFCPYA